MAGLYQRTLCSGTTGADRIARLDGHVPTPTVHKPTPHGPSLAPRTGAVPFFEAVAAAALAVSHQANRSAPLCVSFTNVPLS